MTESSPRNILVLSSDLMLTSQLTGAVRNAGLEPRVVAGSSVAAATVDGNTAGILVDLNQPGINVPELIESLPDPRPHVVAFGPHVHTDRLEAARDAGCDQVLSRGGFLSQASEILSRLVSKSE